MFGDYIWYFDEAVINQVDELLAEGYWEDVGKEILRATNLRTVYTDAVRGSVFNYVSEDKFNDDVLLALRIIDDKYETLLKN